MAAETSSIAPLLVTQKDAAKMLAMSEAWLRKLTRKGKVRAVNIGERGIRYAVADLQAFVHGRKGADHE